MKLWFKKKAPSIIFFKWAYLHFHIFVYGSVGSADKKRCANNNLILQFLFTKIRLGEETLFSFLQYSAETGLVLCTYESYFFICDYMKFFVKIMKKSNSIIVSTIFALQIIAFH